MLSSPCAPGWAGRIDRMKILVADDDPLIRRLLLALLTKLGHEVEVVEEGLSALKILESSTPPDLAILDVHVGEDLGTNLIPDLRVGNVAPAFMLRFARDEDHARLMSLLREAGLPE